MNGAEPRRGNPLPTPLPEGEGTPAPGGWFVGLYRALLWLYPAEFRRRFGAEMVQLVEAPGQVSRAGLLADLMVTAARERWSEASWRLWLPRVSVGGLTAALAASLLVASHRHLLGWLAAARPLLPDGPGALLPALRDPTLAFVLVVAGLYGLIAELSAPGTWLPGGLGLASLAAGLLALASMPANGLGLALLLASVAVFLAGVKLPVHGVLTDAGVLLFTGGSLTLFNFGQSGLAISEPAVLAAAGVTALFFGVVARFGAAARALPPQVTGAEGLVGRLAQTRTRLAGRGQVFVCGERWAATCDETVPAGAAVQIVAVRGLTLVVRAVGG